MAQDNTPDLNKVLPFERMDPKTTCDLSFSPDDLKKTRDPSRPLADVTRIASVLNDNSRITVRDALQNAAQDLDVGELLAEGCFLIFLNTTRNGEKGYFDLRFYAANMLTSEMIAVTETMKAKLLDVIRGKE